MRTYIPFFCSKERKNTKNPTFDQSADKTQYRKHETLNTKTLSGCPDRCLDQRRKQLSEVEPNAAHHALVFLEEKFEVQIITQNVDDLHERAGSSNILHLHGELRKVRSTIDPKAEVSGFMPNLRIIAKKATEGVPEVVRELMDLYA
ncbi:MAG: hypothetical protein FJY10_10810 [Bacteroidetes bacterium]|nr:hypothetical protein [Bacteroidota bacterium]